jgi:hypothetical protein
LVFSIINQQRINPLTCKALPNFNYLHLKRICLVETAFAQNKQIIQGPNNLSNTKSHGMRDKYLVNEDRTY